MVIAVRPAPFKALLKSTKRGKRFYYKAFTKLKRPNPLHKSYFSSELQTGLELDVR